MNKNGKHGKRKVKWNLLSFVIFVVAASVTVVGVVRNSWITQHLCSLWVRVHNSNSNDMELLLTIIPVTVLDHLTNASLVIAYLVVGGSARSIFGKCATHV